MSNSKTELGESDLNHGNFESNQTHRLGWEPAASEIMHGLDSTNEHHTGGGGGGGERNPKNKRRKGGGATCPGLPSHSSWQREPPELRLNLRSGVRSLVALQRFGRFGDVWDSRREKP